MIKFLVPGEQEFGIREYLDMWGPELADHFAIIHYENLADTSHLSPGTYILASLDQLTPEGLWLVGELERALRAAGPAVRLLNSTVRTLSRHALLDTLWRQGLNRHRAVRATAELGGLHFPVFLREEHRHNGSISPLLRCDRELKTELARAVLRCYRLDELLVVEFCETADAQGFYRKYAAHILGTEIVPQFMNLARDWMLSFGKTEWSAAMIREERAYLEGNPHESELRRIFQLAGVQFGRIDYALKDGVIETWEINLNPTIGRYPRLPGELNALRDGTKHHFYRRFLAAVRTLDQSPGSAVPIPIRYSPETLRGRVRMIRRGRRRVSPRLLRAVRPLRPLLDPLIEALSPMILRAARPGRLGPPRTTASTR